MVADLRRMTDMFNRHGGLRRPVPLEHDATLAALLEVSLAAGRHDDLLVTPNESISYAEADRRSAELAQALLIHGFGKGNRIAVMLPTSPDAIVAIVAVLRAGATVVPVNTFYRPREIREQLAASDTTLVLTTDEGSTSLLDRVRSAIPDIRTNGVRGGASSATLPFLRGVWSFGLSTNACTMVHDIVCDPDAEFLSAVTAAIRPADPAAIVYTSGTTSAPKGVVLTHGTITRHCIYMAAALGTESSDRTFAMSPFFWVGGFAHSLLSTIAARATLLSMHRFDADVALPFLAAQKATVVTSTPNVRLAIEGHPDFSTTDLSSVERGLDWPTPPEHRPTLRTYGAFGMTETCGAHVLSAWIDEVDREYPGSRGWPVPGVEHRLVDVASGRTVSDHQVGEVWVRGPLLMDGLYGVERHDVLEPDGWYRTGDLASWHDGCLQFRGRLKSLIKSAGAGVSPGEVEAVLLSHSSVVEAYVVGIPAGERGEDVAAAVVLREGVTETESVLQEFARAELATFKVPKVLKIVRSGQVPRNPTGKLSPTALRDLLSTPQVDA